MEFGKRLKTLRLNRDLTQKELAASVGVSTTTVQCWENGTKSPSMTAIISLSSTLGCSSDTLLGIGDANIGGFSPILNREEKSLVEDFMALDRYGRRLVQTVCRMEKARSAAENGDGSGVIVPLSGRKRERFIPHYTTPSAAGISVPLDGSDFEMIPVSDSVPPDADCAVTIRGDSMAPYIQDGDMVYVKKGAELALGDVGIFCVDGAMYCKQYCPDREGNLLLVSANPELRHTNVRISADGGQNVTIYGKVLLGCKIELPDYLYE